MTSQNLSAQVRYLFKKGHNAADIVNMIEAPKAIVSAEVERYLNEQQSQDMVERSRRSQASYAMKI